MYKLVHDSRTFLNADGPAGGRVLLSVLPYLHVLSHTDGVRQREGVALPREFVLP